MFKHNVLCLLTILLHTGYIHCKDIYCHPPPKVQHGLYHCPHTHPHMFGEQCALSCYHGYTPSGSSHTIECKRDGQWSSALSCTETRCKAPPPVTGGHYRCAHSGTHVTGRTSYQIKDECHLHCERGFSLASVSPTITCGVDGKWSASPRCKERKCGAKPVIANGSYQCPNHRHTLDTECHLHCDAGFKPVSDITKIHCLESEKWSHVGLCVEIKCPSPPSLAHGFYQCTNHTVNAICHVQCDKGYKSLYGHRRLHCLPSESWSTVGRCVERKCPVPPVIQHGLYHCTNHSVNGECTLKCDVGYIPSSGYREIRCQATEMWSNPGYCQEVRCPRLPFVVNGGYQCSTHIYSFNTQCQLRCNSGFRPASNVTKIQCLNSESWSNSGGCVEHRCQTPPLAKHGVYHCLNHSVGSVCHLQCPFGFKPEPGYRKIHCLASETWSRAGHCFRSFCPAPPHISNGSYQCSNHSVSAECILHCDSGYKPNSIDTNIRCHPFEKWSNPGHCIEKACPYPPIIPNGSYQCTNNAYTPGTVCDLQCNAGYKPGSNVTRMSCLDSETWSLEGLCVEMECPPPPTIPHGSYQCTTPVFSLNSECHLHCDQRYRPQSGHDRIQCLDSETWSSPGLCIAVKTTQSLTTRPTTTTPAHLTTTSRKALASSISCEVCSGPLCGVIAGNSVPCPHGKSYCLNHFEKEVDGTTYISKRCATKDECNKRWWLETSDKSSCVKVDPATIVGVKLSCAYCCTTSECNRKTVPDRQTLFVGH